MVGGDLALRVGQHLPSPPTISRYSISMTTPCGSDVVGLKGARGGGGGGGGGG